MAVLGEFFFFFLNRKQEAEYVRIRWHIIAAGWQTCSDLACPRHALCPVWSCAPRLTARWSTDGKWRGLCSFHGQRYRHTVILIYTVFLHAGSAAAAAAQAVVTKAEGWKPSSGLQGLLPRGQQWLALRHRGQKLAVDLLADLLRHALSDLEHKSDKVFSYF